MIKCWIGLYSTRCVSWKLYCKWKFNAHESKRVHDAMKSFQQVPKSMQFSESDINSGSPMWILQFLSGYSWSETRIRKTQNFQVIPKISFLFECVFQSEIWEWNLKQKKNLKNIWSDQLFLENSNFSHSKVSQHNIMWRIIEPRPETEIKFHI